MLRAGMQIVAKPYIGDDRNENYLSASEQTGNIVLAASVLSVIAAVIILKLLRSPA